MWSPSCKLFQIKLPSLSLSTGRGETPYPFIIKSGCGCTPKDPQSLALCSSSCMRRLPAGRHAVNPLRAIACSQRTTLHILVKRASFFTLIISNCLSPLLWMLAYSVTKTNQSQITYAASLKDNFWNTRFDNFSTGAMYNITPSS